MLCLLPLNLILEEASFGRICITDDNRAFHHSNTTNVFTLVGTGIRETDGNLWAIGTDGVLNYRGQPPNTGFTDVAMFTPIPSMTNIRSVFTAGRADATFIIQNPISPQTQTRVFVTGNNSDGQLGLNNMNTLSSITAAPLLANAYDIRSVGVSTSGAISYFAIIGDPSLSAGGQVTLWTAPSGAITPTPIAFLNNIRSFSLSGNSNPSAFFIRIDGTLACFGGNTFNQLGLGNSNDIPVTSIAVPTGPFQGSVVGVRGANSTTVLWTTNQLFLTGRFEAFEYGGEMVYNEDRQSTRTLNRIGPFQLALTVNEPIVNVSFFSTNAIVVHLQSGLALTSAQELSANFPQYAWRTSEDISGDVGSVVRNSLGFQEVKL